MRMIKILLFASLVGLFVVVYTDNSCAAVTKNTITQINDQFKAKAAIYGTVLEKYAKKIFYWCLMLEVALLGARAVFQQSAIAETIAQFVMTLLFAGFCFAVITHYQEWTGNIITGLGKYATEATGVNLTLSPFYIGLDIVKKITDKISLWSPVDSVGYIVVGLVVLGCFCMLSARILVVKCESYIAMNAAILLLGFGGTSLLKEYAINTMRYALSVAFKLFVMQLVMGVGLSFITNLGTTGVEWEDLFVLIACAFILLVLVNTIPEIIAGIINGSHVGGCGGLRSAVAGAAAAVGSATGFAAGAAGTVTSAGRGLGTVSDAVKIASLEGHSGMGKLGATASNLRGAYGDARDAKNRTGTMGQRTSSAMTDRLAATQANIAAKESTKPEGNSNQNS